MNRTKRHSEIRVTGLDGVTYSGQGDGLAAAVRQLGQQHDADPTGDVAALSSLSLADIQARLHPCRHCGLPVDVGIDGALLRARLGLDDQCPVPYVVHLRCQVEVLEQLAEASHEAVTAWRVTPTGAALLASGARS